MSEKVIVMHDASVYKALKQQERFNRRATLFAIATIVCLALLTNTCDRIVKRLEETHTAEE